MTAVLQWLSLAILLAIVGGFAFLFIRHGTKVKPSGNSDGGYPGVGQDGGGSGD